MGANLSSVFIDPNVLSPCGSLYSQSPSSNLTLGDLPESCVASILAYLDPPEICKLARLNRAFRGASWADFVWESKLPANYVHLIQRVFGDDLTRDISKREIYTRLCRPNTFDGGTKVAFF